jgi:hypothetical protein
MRGLLRASPATATCSTRLSGHAIAELVKRAMARAGLDPTDYSGHSLRAGLCTAAAAAHVAPK